MNLTLHLTTACNMRCAYCYAPPVAGPVMSLETGVRTLDLAAELNQGAPSGIIFFGGEPLLCQDRVRELVAYGLELKAQGRARFHFKLTTNGSLLDEAFLGFANDTGLLVAMSLDGTQAAHDRHRRYADGAASYATLSPKLDLLLRYQPHATVLSVVNPDTVEHFAASACELIERGVRYLVVSVNYDAPWTESQLEALVEQYELLAEHYEAWTRAGRKFYLSPFEMCIGTHLAGPDAGHSHRCELGEKQISVDPEGWLYPCVQFTRQGPGWRIGSVFGGIDEAARRALRDRSSAVKQPCGSCALEPRCPNTCGCLNLQTTGSLDEVSPVLCHQQQRLIPIADRLAERLFRDRVPDFLQKHYNRSWPLLSFLDDTRGFRGD
jgi:uncharacterized protein